MTGTEPRRLRHVLVTLASSPETRTGTTGMNTPTADRIHLYHRLAELCVGRGGISFHNVAPDRVLIEIEVENRGPDCSDATQLRLESAPFGAFVRWKPLATVRVPAIPPGGATWVRTIARQPRPQPIASLSGLVPRGLLTAAGAGESRKPTLQLSDAAFTNLFLVTLLGGRRPAGELPPDLLDLLDGPRPHWAGNLNVWIRRRPVERHMAPRLRVHPARANMALFCLGDGPDQYAFRMERPGSDWRYALYDLGARKAVLCRGDGAEPRWHSVPSMHPMLFAVRPPDGCARGAAVVHVTQRSSGKTAAIEFDLDPASEGPGCYTV